MAIRNAAKAIIVHDDKILVNRCKSQDTGAVYYALPGGGQHQFETMEDAVVREVLEETGYRVEIIRFAGLAEEIFLSEELRKKYSDYTHRISHIFLVKIADEKALQPSEVDFEQEESVWLSMNEIKNLPFQPRLLAENIEKMVRENSPIYLGCEYI